MILLHFFGDRLVRFFTQTYNFYRYFIHCVAQFRQIYFYRRQIVDQCYAIGIGSLSLVCLISIFSGMAVSIQMAYQMEAYVPDYMVGSVVLRSVVLELAPVLIGLVLAGRVGAGVASELGTMKVSEQIDALTSLAVDPVGYLMMPRFIAGLIMIPVLVVFASTVSVSAGMVIAIFKLDISTFAFIKGMKMDFQPYDVFVGLAKATVFGGLITLIGCFMGLETRGGAQGVGRAATSAVVVASTLILILDYFLTHALLY